MCDFYCINIIKNSCGLRNPDKYIDINKFEELSFRYIGENSGNKNYVVRHHYMKFGDRADFVVKNALLLSKNASKAEYHRILGELSKMFLKDIFPIDYYEVNIAKYKTEDTFASGFL